MVSHKPNAFNDEAIQRFFPMCYSLAIALRNARLFHSIKESSITDSLTHIYNRRCFDDIIGKEFLRANRYKHPLSIALIDIDNFKTINDTYGHRKGDKVLRQLANLIMKTIRNTDILARYGGEEFSIIMPLTDIEVGIIVMERLRVVIAESLFPHHTSSHSTHREYWFIFSIWSLHHFSEKTHQRVRFSAVPGKKKPARTGCVFTLPWK